VEAEEISILSLTHKGIVVVAVIVALLVIEELATPSFLSTQSCPGTHFGAVELALEPLFYTYILLEYTYTLR